MDIQELKKTIRLYLEAGNNLKPYLGKQQLTELKTHLTDLKEALSDEEWNKQIGRLYLCFVGEIDYKLGEYEQGTSPNQTTPTSTPSQPVEIPTHTERPTTETPSETTTPSSSTDTTPTTTPTTTPDTTPGSTRPSTPTEPTPEELVLENYNSYLKSIKAEVDSKKLEDNGEWDKKIKALDYNLLDSQHQPLFLQEARQERLKALSDKQNQQKWDKWFINKGILDQSEQNGWKATLNNSDQADLLFSEALKRDINDQEWDPVLTDEEAKGINESKSPADIKNAQSAIKNKRDNIKIASELLEDLNNWTDLATILRSRDIKAKYNEEWVPDNLKYEKLKEARNATRAKLFKTAFEGATPSQLTPEEIEAWRQGSDSERQGKAGLNGLGTEERTAFNHKWEVNEILNRKVASYKVDPEEVKDIDPLKVNKEQLKTALEILNDINDINKTTFKSLPENYRETEIKALPSDLPAQANPTRLLARIKARRATFSLSLNQVDDEAFTQEQLDIILGKLKNIYPVAEYKPFTADLANEVLRWNITGKETPAKGKQPAEPVPVPKLTPTIDEDLEPWLLADEQKGYRIEDEDSQFIEGQPPIKGKEYTGAEVVKQEDEWAITNQRDKQSKLLLPFFCKKVKYDYNDPEAFLRELGNPTKGKLPYATGSGKTTKIIMCLTCLMRDKSRNVVLVLPTQLLKSSAANHHKTWLQEYECSLHDKKHGEYKVNVDELGEGLSILYYPYLAGYIIRELINWNSKELKILVKEAAKKPDLKAKLDAMKEGTTLKKLNPLIMADEGHWPDGTYQALKDGTLELGYPIIEMSATFQGVPWSITTPYKGIDRKVDGFKPEHIEPTDKTGIFIKNRLTDTQKKILTKAGVCWVEFDAGMAPAAEGITLGLPPGAVFFFTWIYEAGVTMDLKNVIITNWLETTKLGGGWKYDPAETQKSPIASLGQQRGRVNRLYKGRAFFLVGKDGKLEYEEVKQTDDAGTIFLKYALTGGDKLAKKIKYKDFQDLTLTRLCLAWPDKFGLRPEEILIGAKLGIVAGGQYPLFPEVEPTLGGFDKDLWDRHRKIIKPNDMPEQTAKDIIAQMIGNLLISPRKGNNFPEIINVEIESPLIAQIKWKPSNKRVEPKKEGDPVKWVKQDNTPSIEECRSMINGKIAQELRKLNGYEDSKIKYKDEKTFNKIVAIYKLIDGLNITIKQEFKDELIDKKKPELGKRPKDALTLRITYDNTTPIIATQRKINRTFIYDKEREREREKQPITQ